MRDHFVRRWWSLHPLGWDEAPKLKTRPPINFALSFMKQVITFFTDWNITVPTTCPASMEVRLGLITVTTLANRADVGP